MKIEALAASAVTLILTWRCARAREIDPVRAVLIVGLNPLYLREMPVQCAVDAGFPQHGYTPELAEVA